MIVQNTYRRRVLKRRVNLGLPQEHVPAARAPQHALERRDALAQDHARHETAHAHMLHVAQG